MNSASGDANGAVCFLSVAGVRRLVGAIGLPKVMHGLVDAIEVDFRRWEEFNKVPRVTQATGEGFIELMPVSDQHSYGFKYVHCHPGNALRRDQTVTGFGALARIDSGHTYLLAEMTLLTALRTAATSVMAAKYLAPEGARTMAIIGSGAQCEFQALAFHYVLGITTVRLYDVDPLATAKAVQNLSSTGLHVVACATAQDAVAGAEIITTCTASVGNGRVLTDNMVGAGVHINAIGGDCEGKTELQADILRRSDVFVEYPPQTRIEGEIQQLDPEHPVTELWKVVAGHAAGRVSSQQTTVFDSVGFAIEDFSALRYVHDLAVDAGLSEWIDILANPDDPKNLFGLLLCMPECDRPGNDGVN
ncbi:ornithine cyclodeaminase [Tropicimonas aquimaris]|uniref:Ornithine cyclodeaminase n=1 Tax=Tropicimonas aquimaris TaxID=914152 RepID=A0ABW3IXQ5_9RHOB